MADTSRPPMADMYAHLCAILYPLSEIESYLRQLDVACDHSEFEHERPRIRGLAIAMQVELHDAVCILVNAQARQETVGKAPVLKLVQGGRNEA